MTKKHTTELNKNAGLQTRALHQATSLNETHAITPPIWQTTTFRADSPDHLAELGEATRPTEFYTRYGNPTLDQVEATIAGLEGGEAALVASSGMGAIFSAVMTLLRSGDHIVAQQTHYAATMKMFRDLLPRWGIDCTFVDQTKTEEFEAAIRPNTKLIYIESPSNPLLKLTDIEGVASVAKAKGILTMIDNTFATPVNQQPLKLGVDVVLHAATKYLAGHHDLMAGVVISNKSYVDEVWDFSLMSGSILSPFDGWLLLRGMKTLGLRVDCQNRNALAVAQYLEQHPRIERVNYPGLESHPQHALARRQMSGFGGMMSVVLKGEYDGAKVFIERLKIAQCAVSLGGVETLVTHAASMWSHQHTRDQQRAAGIDSGLVRISIGVEDERDLIADFEQALQ